LAIIETPGKLKKGQKAKIIGIVVFSSDILYKTKSQWKKDREKHFVKDEGPLFGFQDERPKYGWIVEKTTKISPLEKLPKTRGIVFANGCEVPILAYTKIMKS